MIVNAVENAVWCGMVNIGRTADILLGVILLSLIVGSILVGLGFILGIYNFVNIGMIFIIPFLVVHTIVNIGLLIQLMKAKFK